MLHEFLKETFLNKKDFIIDFKLHSFGQTGFVHLLKDIFLEPLLIGQHLFYFNILGA